METKAVSRIVITGVLVLGLGLLQHAQALGCSPSQLQCIEVCDDEDIPHEQCVKECGCSELNLLLHSKSAGLGLQHAHAQVGGCSPSQIQCVEVCDDEGTPHETCVKECGCSEANLLHSKAAGCRLQARPSATTQTNVLDISARVKEQCKDVCYSLCAKGIDITATAA